VIHEFVRAFVALVILLALATGLFFIIAVLVQAL
jgi:hypothetical protein